MFPYTIEDLPTAEGLEQPLCLCLRGQEARRWDAEGQTAPHALLRMIETGRNWECCNRQDARSLVFRRGGGVLDMRMAKHARLVKREDVGGS